MAIYHLSVKTISRSAGRSATAAAAYRAGVSITDEHTGETHDYTRKGGVESATLILPAHAPEWATDRAALWNAAEQSETRKNSTVAREFEVALPAELSSADRQRLAHDFARLIVERHGCAVDVAIHAPGKEGDNRNHHAHILLTTRRLGPEGFTTKTRELDERSTKEVDGWRERFATLQNERLADAGVQVQVDHRSLAAQGIEREPTKHLGPAATGYERRTGEPSDVRIRHQLEAVERLARAKEIGDLEREGRALDRSILDLTGDLRNALAERESRAMAEAMQAGLANIRAQAAAHQLAKEQAAAQAQAQAEADKWPAMAQAFENDAPAAALKKYPELVHSYAVAEAMEKRMVFDGLSQAEQDHLSDRFKKTLARNVMVGQPVGPESAQQILLQLEAAKEEKAQAAQVAQAALRQDEPAEQLPAAVAIMARWDAAVLAERAAHLGELTRRAEAEMAAATELRQAHLAAKPLLFGREKWEQQRNTLEHHLHRKQRDFGALKNGTYPSFGPDEDAVQETSEQRAKAQNPALARSVPEAAATIQTEYARLERLRRIELSERQERRSQEREQRSASRRDSGRDRGFSR